MFKTLAMLAAVAYRTLAQEVITGTVTTGTYANPSFTSTLAAPTPTTSSYTVKYSDTADSGYPMKTLLIPLNYIGNVAASVMTAAPESTVYGLACLHLLADGGCPETPSITMTEGESTLLYTMTGSDPSHGPTTINCALTGGSRATRVVCTGSSSVSGLGAVSSVSTLSGSQLSYIPVSVTAGAEKLSQAATATAATTGAASSTQAVASETSSAAGAMVTVARMVAGGAAGIAMLGMI